MRIREINITIDLKDVGVNTANWTSAQDIDRGIVERRIDIRVRYSTELVG